MIQFAPLFHDYAVLQRDRSIPVWGSAEVGEPVTVHLGSASAEIEAGPDGSWFLRLPPQPAGGPWDLVAETPSGQVVAHDVLIGDVWICSGQSNMEWELHQVDPVGQQSAGVDLPRIRLLTMKTPARLGRQTDIDGRWAMCKPETLHHFSAVAGWFGRYLHEHLDVPIGLIVNAWGGTRIQAWISREALIQDRDGATEIAAYDAQIFAPGSLRRRASADYAEWERQCAAAEPSDHRVRDLGWLSCDFDHSAWPTMAVPSRWQDHGIPDSGILVFRRDLVIPSSWCGRDLILRLGAVDKHDDTWVEGERVGGVGWENIAAWCTPRVYQVPARLVTRDRLSIAVRARSHVYHGGLTGPTEEMRLHPVDDPAAVISVAGDWHFQAELLHGVVVPPVGQPGPGNANSPAILFESRLAPLIPYGIRGAIWYQGESNAHEARLYRRQFPLLIRDWRRAWGQGDFPFLFVQLAAFMAIKDQPSSSQWAELRDAQAEALAEPATGMAVAIDIGDPIDIHPPEKREVGRRLALLALADIHQLPVASRGPRLVGATIESGHIRVRFRDVAGFTTRDGLPPRQLTIAGVDRRFTWADARIEGDTLVAWSAAIAEPVAIRYAWADNPASANLINHAGLPAAPFRSDDWPM